MEGKEDAVIVWFIVGVLVGWVARALTPTADPNIMSTHEWKKEAWK
jgi:hypothetical protein